MLPLHKHTNWQQFRWVLFLSLAGRFQHLREYKPRLCETNTENWDVPTGGSALNSVTWSERDLLVKVFIHLSDRAPDALKKFPRRSDSLFPTLNYSHGSSTVVQASGGGRWQTELTNAFDAAHLLLKQMEILALSFHLGREDSTRICVQCPVSPRPWDTSDCQSDRNENLLAVGFWACLWMVTLMLSFEVEWLTFWYGSTPRLGVRTMGGGLSSSMHWFLLVLNCRCNVKDSLKLLLGWLFLYKGL